MNGAAFHVFFDVAINHIETGHFPQPNTFNFFPESLTKLYYNRTWLANGQIKQKSQTTLLTVTDLFCKTDLQYWFTQKNQLIAILENSLDQFLFWAFGRAPLESIEGHPLNKAETHIFGNGFPLADWLKIFWLAEGYIYQDINSHPPRQINFHICYWRLQRWLLLGWSPKKIRGIMLTHFQSAYMYHVAGERFCTKLSHSDRGKIRLPLFCPLWLSPINQISFWIGVAREHWLYFRGPQLPGG